MADQVTPGPLATVTGRVLDEAGVPVPRAAVHAFEEGARWFTDMHLLAAGPADEQGRFRLEIPAGPVLLVAAGHGDVLHRPEASEAAHGTRAVLPADGPPLEIDLRLPWALAGLGRVEGIVRDAAGKGVAGVSVGVDGTSLHAGTRRILTTDAEGRFSIAGLIPGERSIEIGGSRRFEPTTLPFTLEPGATASPVVTITARARPGTLRVLVRCVDEAGAPLPGVRLHLWGGGGFDEQLVCGPDGAMPVEGLPDELAETWLHIGASHPGRSVRWHRMQPPKEPWRDEVVIRLEPRTPVSKEPTPAARRLRPGAPPPVPDARVSGTVVDAAGVPVAEADISWSPVGESEPASGPALGVHSIGRTDAAGRFLLRGLPAGPATLGVELFGASIPGAGPGRLATADVVLEAGRETTGVEIRLPFAFGELAILECRVVDDEGRSRTGVSVTSDRHFRCLEPGGNESREGPLVFQVFPGLCDVHAWETATHEGVHLPVDAAPRSRTQVVLRTPARSGANSLALRVRVEDQNGAPIPGAKVHLSNQEGGVGEGQTGRDGECLFPALPDGLRARELHVSAYGDGFFIGTPGATVDAWPDAGEASALVVLRRPVHFRYRVVDDLSGGAVPFNQVETRSPHRVSHRSSTNFLSDIPERDDALPGPLLLRASAPGYEVAEVRAELAHGQPEPFFEIRMKRKAT